jgi:nucleoside-diphosphate-sugar epimerase
MRVFVTGAPGFIGSAVLEELLKKGHTVLGLARSDASAEKVSNTGAEVHRGDIEDLESLKSGARAADGVIHLAFIHDFDNFVRGCEVDQAAIQAMAEAMEGTNKPLVIASGLMLLPPGKVSDENTEPNWDFPMAIRGKAETLTTKLSHEKNIRGSSVRLSPTVHGKGDKGFITMLGNFAKKAGFITRVGDGKSHWPAVARSDAASLFVLALEKGKAGAVYHGAAEEGVEMNEIWEAISKRINLPVETKSIEEAQQAVGFFAHAIGLDVMASSEKTQKELGWIPKGLGLIADIEANYF